AKPAATPLPALRSPSGRSATGVSTCSGIAPIEAILPGVPREQNYSISVPVTRDGLGIPSAPGLPGPALVFVAQPAHGDQMDRVGRVGLDFGAESFDVYVECFGVADVVAAPDGFDQLAAREDPARVRHEVFEQVELLER